MKIGDGETGAHEQACARVAARFPRGFLRYYAGTKLRSDPVYPAVYDLIRTSTAPLLDVGCGAGLLAFYLRERGWKNRIVGLDFDARKVREAKRAAGAHDAEMIFSEGDVREKLPDFSGHVAVLDLLHYLTPAQQQNLLRRLVDCVAPQATLLLRDAPRDSSARWWLTFVGEKFAQVVRWNVRTPLHFPSCESIQKNIPAENFDRETRPLWGATPFNNHLFTFRRREREAVPRRE